MKVDRVTRISCLVIVIVPILLICLPGCAKLHVHPLLPVDEETQYPAGVEKLAIHIDGVDVNRPDFARAYSYYRIFSSRMHNETGTPADLLREAVREIFRRKSIAECQDCAEGIRISIPRFTAAWVPPREFIETPTPKERGQIVIDVRIETAVRGRALPAFEHNRKIAAFPGEEANVLSLEVRRALRAYLDWLLAQDLNRR